MTSDPATLLGGYRYSSLLDGEMAAIAEREDAVPPATFAARAERILKIHAVLGSPIALSDVQLIDSVPVLRMFSNSGFRSFLETDPEWLALVTRPSVDDAALDPRHAAANSGLRRALAPGWLSSAFPTPSGTRALVDVAKELLDIGPRLGPAGTRAQLERSGVAGNLASSVADGRSAVEGLVHAYTFMGGSAKSACIVAPAWDDSHRFYEQLARFRGIQGLVEGHEKVIEETLGFIDERSEGDEKRRNQRSLLKRNLEAEPDPRKRRRIWHTAVHAYNHANVRSLGVRGGAYAYLSDEVPIAAYDDAVSGFLIEGDIVKALPSGPAESLLDYFLGGPDFSALSWAQIAEIVRTADVAESRRGYRAAIVSTDSADDGPFLREHLTRLASAVVGKIHSYNDGGGWGTLAIAVGGDLAVGHTLGGGTALQAGVLMRAEVMKRARTYQVMETLRRYRH